MPSKAPLPSQLNQLLLQAAGLGISMHVKDGNLQLEGDIKRLEAAQVALLREHKSVIIDFLQSCDERLQLGPDPDCAHAAAPSAGLHLVRVAMVDGRLDASLVAGAMAALAAHHPQLAGPGLFIEAHCDARLDLPGAEAWLRAAMAARPTAPFLACLLRHAGGQALLLAAAPQVADQASLTLLLRTLCAPPPPPPAPTFAAFAAAERRMLTHPRNRFRTQLACATLGASAQPGAPATAYNANARRVRKMTPAAALDLQRLAAEQRVTPLALVMTAFEFAAQCSDAGPQLWFSVLHANRSAHPFTATIGPLERAVPVCLAPDPVHSFAVRAGALQAALSFAYEHQDLALYPPHPGAGRLDLRIALAERAGPPLALGAAALTSWQAAPWSADTALALWVRAGDGTFELELLFDTASLSEEQADSLLDHAGFLLDNARLVKECGVAQLPANGAARAAFVAARRSDPAVIGVTVCAIFATVLDVAAVSPDSNFFELSGNSLSVAKVVSRIQREFEVAVSFSDVFRHPTARALSALLASRGRSANPGLKALTPADELPAAPQQVRYFASYNVSLVGSGRMSVLHGEWDHGALFEAALQHVVQRHQFLRTAYFERDGVLMQRVMPVAAVSCKSVPVAPDSVALQRRGLETTLRATNFDLGQAPLIRAVTCARAGGGVYSAVAVFNGIIDAYSEALLEDELRTAYALAVAGQLGERAPLALQYQDFARWQHALAASDQMDTARRYWEQQYQLDYPAFHLPPKSGLAGQPRSGEMRVFLLGEELSVAVGEAAAACESSLFGFLLASFFELAATIYQRNDVSVGLLYHGRDSEEMEHMIGYFVDALCLRCDVVPGEDAGTLARRVNETLFAAIDRRTYQYQDLAARFGRTPTEPVFPICGFHVNNVIVPRREKQVPPEFTQQVLALPYAPKFDFNIYVHQSNRGILLRMAYATTVVSTAEAEQIAERFIALVSHNTRAHRKEWA